MTHDTTQHNTDLPDFLQACGEHKASDIDLCPVRHLVQALQDDIHKQNQKSHVANLRV